MLRSNCGSLGFARDDSRCGCAAVDAGMEFDCVGECLGATAGPSASLGMTVVEIVRLLKQGWSLIAG
jgi:hypothetical protein